MSLAAATGAATTIVGRDARIAAGAMVAIAAVRPIAPVDLGIPCPLRTVTGIPCPLCGMTRGVTALMHGELERALLANPGALLAVAVALAVLVRWRARRYVVPVWLLLGVLGALWSWQLFKYATGRAL